MHLEAGHMAEQHAVAVQRALRRARRAGRIDHHGRIVGAAVDGGEGAGVPGKKIMEILRVGIARRLGRDDDVERRQVLPDGLQAFEAEAVGDDGLRLGILQPEGKGIGAEEQGQRQGDGAALVDRDMGDHRLEALRQQDRHPIAPADAFRLQRRGEGVRAGGKFAIGHGERRGVGQEMLETDAVRLARRPGIGNGGADVEAFGDLPAEIPVQGVVGRSFGKHPVSLQFAALQLAFRRAAPQWRLSKVRARKGGCRPR